MHASKTLVAVALCLLPLAVNARPVEVPETENGVLPPVPEIGVPLSPVEGGETLPPVPPKFPHTIPFGGPGPVVGWDGWEEPPFIPNPVPVIPPGIGGGVFPPCVPPKFPQSHPPPRTEEGGLPRPLFAVPIPVPEHEDGMPPVPPNVHEKIEAKDDDHKHGDSMTDLWHGGDDEEETFHGSNEDCNDGVC